MCIPSFGKVNASGVVVAVVVGAKVLLTAVDASPTDVTHTVRIARLRESAKSTSRAVETIRRTLPKVCTSCGRDLLVRVEWHAWR